MSSRPKSMRIRKNRSELEDKVSQLWEELAFRDGGFASRPVSREVAIQNEVDRQTEWESIYNLAYVDGVWKVGGQTASAISRSRWNNAMAVGSFDLAEELIKRRLDHPEPLDRQDSCDLPIRLWVTRLVRDRNPEAARSLADLMNSGIYRSGTIAQFAGLTLLVWLDANKSGDQVSDEVRSLAAEIARAKRRSKRKIQASEDLHTWVDFERYVWNALGYKPAEAIASQLYIDLKPFPSESSQFQCE